ncbi:MAG TPA: aminoacyl-tRNA hydrolase [Thermoanaerobaculia bacterium]|nr:aminoacyl-tRNA hydrolase [Thermoanaerobaculia bacterium]
MKMILGLGNPGADYERTRHNVGWQVVDAFARKFRIDVSRHEKNALTGTGRVAGGSVLVAKPLTYMNLSGEAVRLLVNAYGEANDDLVVVYDDIDLPLGRLRIRPNGSAGTHNGMRSILEALGREDFPRLRIGIGASEQGTLRDYVLDEFSPDEQPVIDRAIGRAVDALVLIVRGDLRRAMNEFNRDAEEPSPPPC